ncbi:hypothetical protein HK099_001110 [Clydaea vesicula]|uniref:Uncharacterized protein n=1 Tax=Clydaea vesicula TaxID=447962 RepID=A0AAD5TVX5_9FUNG|nr:hypothetical protein HK099_001110 [Clydaea vesicula]
MKGLFLSHLEKRAEAHEFIRKGLKQDLTSHICWHVYGLLHRGEKNYEEAIKCYSHALKYDKENMHIIRDYSLLQVQMRNFEGYTDTRYQLLQLKPNNKLYWIGLAVAHHLNNDHASALHVLDTFETSLNELPVNYLDYEHSEMLLYKNLILEEMGDLKVALTHLERIKKNVLDLTSWKESKARILMKLKNFELASIIFSELFESNSDSLEYLKGLEECRGLNRGQPNENVNKVIAFYENLKNMYPKSHIVQSVPLFYTKEENFSNALSEYLKPSLLKGVPSLFVTLKDLYNEEWRIELIYQLLIKFYDNLVNIQKFEESEEELAAPTATLWTAYFIAQHFDYLRDSDKALEWIDVAIDHSPTLADACMIKAKILKHAGDKKSAAEAMNEARELDLQDRFINTKCTKYMLRNNEDLKAKETIGLFTKADVDTIEDLKEMQCMWYFIELGKCYSSQYNFEKSLKTFKFVDKVFVDIFDDQFDFHSYCLRKMTLTDYGKLLKTEDTIKKNKFFVKSSLGALNCYEKILDKKLGKDSNIFNGESDESKLSVSEQKKLARKQRKIEEKLLKEKFEQESKNKENTKTNREKTDEKKSNADTKKIEDDDPEGKKILELDIDIILKEAIKTFLEPLLEFSPSLIEGWCFGIEFYTRQEKYLLAWKCLKTGVKLSKFDPEIIKKSVKFLHHFYENFDNVNATVSEIFFSELMEIDPFELNLQDEAKNKELIKTTLDKLMSKLENFNTTLHQFVLLELHLELFNKDSQEAFINFQNYFKGKKVQTIRGWECKRFGWEAEFKLNEEKDDKIVLIGMDMAKKILTYIRNIKEFDDKNEILEFFKNFFVKFDALI